MKPFASVPAALPRSGIREIMDLAWATEGVIHLEVGQPDFDTPAHIVEAACAAARQGHTKYIPNAGITELRESVARYLTQSTGVATGAEQIIVTHGAVMSIATAFLALLEPDEEVLLPDPGWPNYTMAVSLLHGKSVNYNLRPEDGFLPDLDELEKLVTGKTKLLLLCSPSNPTGQVHDADLTRRLVEFARRHDLYILSDEIYAEIVFDGDHASALSYDNGDERVILVTGMSKAFAMTGFRVGFTRATPEYVELAAKIQEPFVSCGVAIAQMASIAGLDGSWDSVTRMRDRYKGRRDIALDVLREFDLYRYTPGGAFYLLVDISSTGADSGEFAIELVEKHGVAVAPGNTFGANCGNHIRISYAAPEEDVREGLTRICRAIRG